MLQTVSNLELIGAVALVLVTLALVYALGRVHGRDSGYANAIDDLSTSATPIPPPPPRCPPVYEGGYGVRRVGYSAILPNGHGNPCICDACCGMYGNPSPR